jgi:hypothetical protein
MAPRVHIPARPASDRPSDGRSRGGAWRRSRPCRRRHRRRSSRRALAGRGRRRICSATHRRASRGRTAALGARVSCGSSGLGGRAAAESLIHGIAARVAAYGSAASCHQRTSRSSRRARVRADETEGRADRALSAEIATVRCAGSPGSTTSSRRSRNVRWHGSMARCSRSSASRRIRFCTSTDPGVGRRR